VHARQHGVGELHGEFGAGAVQVALEDLLDLHPRVGVVALARQVDEARIEAAVEVAAHEDAGLAPVAEAQHAERGFEERVLVDLQQLVARVVLQHREQVLVHVARRAESRALDHARDLAPEQRHLVGIGMVGRRGVKADEAALPHDLAGVVELLQADVVEVARAVHRGARVRLREHEQLGLAGERADLGGELGEAVRDPAEARLAQHAESRARHYAQLVLAIDRFELVLAVSQEREVILPRPVEERADLVRLLAFEKRGRVVELGDHRRHALVHRLPVLDRGAHVAEHRGDPAAERLQPLGVDLAVDLDVDERLVMRVLRRRAE
jgi:hypothetical protein